VRVLFVENADSFSYNLIDCLPVPRERVLVVAANAASRKLAEADALVIGPGPKDPTRAGLVELVHSAAARRLPTLGVCLGHQAIGLAFGCRLVRVTPTHGKTSDVTFDASRQLAGIKGVFQVMRYHSLALETPDSAEWAVGTHVSALGSANRSISRCGSSTEAARRSGAPSVKRRRELSDSDRRLASGEQTGDSLGQHMPVKVIASSSDGVVMALEHRILPMVGFQFHPDSFGTPFGREMVQAFFRGLP
jgi:anthranilate/para-aminobenzoate synthase component II